MEFQFTREELDGKNVFNLRQLARKNNIDIDDLVTKEDFLEALCGPKSNVDKKVDTKESKAKKSKKTTTKKNSKKDSANTESEKKNVEIEVEEKEEDLEIRSGVLDIHQDGFGFLRVSNYEHSDNDVYVSNKLIKASDLRKGDYIKGKVKTVNINKPASLVEILEINSLLPEKCLNRPDFDTLIPIYPNERYKLEQGDNCDFAARCIDLIAPIGKGQRALIVSPPKAGKTTILKKIANAITNRYKDVRLFVFLVDERPEEVTDMKRSINGEVVHSTFDETPEHHTMAAELVISRAKREVELGKDVVIIMDSLTRLARAYNLTIPPTGRTLSGGIDPGALHFPKRFFGAARNIENGGSLTIIATALVDTGSRMDDVIYEEFKGTGNMEVHLDRKLAEKRIFPAIDLNKSSTRREDLLLTPDELAGSWTIRQMLSRGENVEAAETIIGILLKTKNNAEFINIVSERSNVAQKAQQMAGFVFNKNV